MDEKHRIRLMGVLFPGTFTLGHVENGLIKGTDENCEDRKGGEMSHRFSDLLTAEQKYLSSAHVHPFLG